MNRCSKTGLTDKDFKTILDVLNVYDPNDIVDHIPEMATPEFVQDVHSAFRTVLKHVNTLRYGPDHVQKMDQSDYSTIEGCIRQNTNNPLNDLDEQDHAEADTQRYREDRIKESQALAHDQYIHGLS